MGLFSPGEPKRFEGSKRPQPEKQDIFGKKGYIPTEKFWYKLKEGSAAIPGTSRYYSKKDVEKFLKENFSRSEYGDYIGRKEAERVIEGLKEGGGGKNYLEKDANLRRGSWLARETGMDGKGEKAT